jgi:hypothetical protein
MHFNLIALIRFTWYITPEPWNHISLIIHCNASHKGRDYTLMAINCIASSQPFYSIYITHGLSFIVFNATTHNYFLPLSSGLCTPNNKTLIPFCLLFHCFIITTKKLSVEPRFRRIWRKYVYTERKFIYWFILNISFIHALHLR